MTDYQIIKLTDNEIKSKLGKDNISIQDYRCLGSYYRLFKDIDKDEAKDYLLMLNKDFYTTDLSPDNIVSKDILAESCYKLLRAMFQIGADKYFLYYPFTYDSSIGNPYLHLNKTLLEEDGILKGSYLTARPFFLESLELLDVINGKSITMLELIQIVSKVISKLPVGNLKPDESHIIYVENY